MKKIAALVLLGAGLALSSVVFAADEKAKTETAAASTEHVMYAAADLKWSDAPPSLPAGAKIAVLDGDPGKQGMFTIRLQMPAGYKIPAHTHPTAEHVTVISGTTYLGMGPKLDDNAAKTMTAGGYVVLPAGMQHFAGTKEGCVVQVHAMGPFEIKYVNPADDPRQARK